MSVFEKGQEVYRVAQQLYAMAPDWVTFYREILGVRGIVRYAFPKQEEMAEFERSDAYQEIQRMLTKLRQRGPVAANPDEPTKVITVRIPKSLHDALRSDAHQHRTSINKLCISKLLQFIDQDRVPKEFGEVEPGALPSELLGSTKAFGSIGGEEKPEADL